MSDKSKLGFNINPKKYDELNSTDNLITSGSDSGWLGKKLQGDDSNDLNLSKINPLFDKELYEKYRPGVNTHDGSVNQDIWGFKCFNGPVSFRNGIYGDTYNIQSVEGGDKTLGICSGVSIQSYQKNTTNNVSTLDNKHYSYNVYFESEILGLKEDKYIASTYTGNLRVETFVATISNYQLFYNSYVNGSSIENISSRTSNGYGYDYCKLYTFNNPKNTELSIYNGIDIYSDINTNNESSDEINIASSKCDTSGSKFPYKVSRITVGTNCNDDPTLEQEQSVSGNCIRMYSANGDIHGYHTNDAVSSIFITPESLLLTSKDPKENGNNPFIEIKNDNSITLHAKTINLPETIQTTIGKAEFADRAKILAKDADTQNYIIASSDAIIPSMDSIISLGSKYMAFNCLYTGYIGEPESVVKRIYAHTIDATTIYAEKIGDEDGYHVTNAYIDTIGSYTDPVEQMYIAGGGGINNNYIKVHKPSGIPAITPSKNNTGTLGTPAYYFNNAYINNIYGTLKGNAISATTADSATKAIQDAEGNTIHDTYAASLWLDDSTNNIVLGTKGHKKRLSTLISHEMIARNLGNYYTDGTCGVGAIGLFAYYSSRDREISSDKRPGTLVSGAYLRDLIIGRDFDTNNIQRVPDRDYYVFSKFKFYVGYFGSNNAGSHPSGTWKILNTAQNIHKIYNGYVVCIVLAVRVW